MVEMCPSQEHVYDYYIDEHGDWFCEGNPVTDSQLFRLLSRSLFEREGLYFIRCEGETHPVRVADAPLWIRYVHMQTNSEEQLIRVEIELQDGRREPLSPETLRVARDNALYCLATQRRLRARFGKVAYYELTRYVEMKDDGKHFFIVIDSRHYDIRPDSDGQGCAIGTLR